MFYIKKILKLYFEPSEKYISHNKMSDHPEYELKKDVIYINNDNEITDHSEYELKKEDATYINNDNEMTDHVK